MLKQHLTKYVIVNFKHARLTEHLSYAKARCFFLSVRLRGAFCLINQRISSQRKSTRLDQKLNLHSTLIIEVEKKLDMESFIIPWTFLLFF